MFSSSLFTLTRILEILTLIPIWGMLAWFVDAWQPATPPDYILYLFIVTLIATVWAFFTLLLYRSVRWTPLYFSVVDLCFFGVLIGGVVILAPYVRHTDCVNYSGPSITYLGNGQGTYSAGSLNANRQCLMLKSSWGLAIVDILLFFFSSVLAWHVWHNTGVVEYHERPRRRRRHAGW